MNFIVNENKDHFSAMWHCDINKQNFTGVARWSVPLILCIPPSARKPRESTWRGEAMKKNIRFKQIQGRWLDKPSVYHIPTNQRNQIIFHCQLNQVATAQGLLLSTERHQIPASWLVARRDAPQCLTTLWPKSVRSKAKSLLHWEKSWVPNSDLNCRFGSVHANLCRNS